jgi:hypothetical protein
MIPLLSGDYERSKRIRPGGDGLLRKLETSDMTMERHNGTLKHAVVAGNDDGVMGNCGGDLKSRVKSCRRSIS